MTNEKIASITPLTTREQEILGHLRGGLAPKEIAAKLNISVNTARNHTKKIYQKIGVQTRAQLITSRLPDSTLESMANMLRSAGWIVTPPVVERSEEKLVDNMECGNGKCGWIGLRTDLKRNGSTDTCPSCGSGHIHNTGVSGSVFMMRA